MPVTIEIKQEQIKDLIEFYQSRQEKIKSEISLLHKEQAEISSTIMQLRQSQWKSSGGEIKLSSTGEVYQAVWPWAKKISFVLSQSGKALTTKEIVETIINYQPEFALERRKVVASVSSTLSVKTGEYFIKEKGESGDYVYRLNNLDDIIEKKPEKPGFEIDFDDLPF